jgi:hypothetical protein
LARGSHRIISPTLRSTSKPARIFQCCEAEFERIFSGGEGELIHEALDRHDIADLARRSQIGGAQRRILQPMRRRFSGTFHVKIAEA